MTYSREDSRRYARENIDRICAEQGITVAITDPSLLATTAKFLRIGKDRLNAARVELPPRTRRRRNENVSNVRD